LLQLGARQRAAYVADRRRLGEPYLDQRAPREVDAVVETAVPPDRHQAGKDEEPRRRDRDGRPAQEVDPGVGRDDLGEVWGGNRPRRPAARRGLRGCRTRRTRGLLHMLTVVMRRSMASQSYTTRVRNTAVVIVVRMPRQSVTANPRTGPVPN